jgi:hypothetical protein
MIYLVSPSTSKTELVNNKTNQAICTNVLHFYNGKKKLLHKCGRIWHKKWINHDIPPFLEKMSDLTAKVMN